MATFMKSLSLTSKAPTKDGIKKRKSTKEEEFNKKISRQQDPQETFSSCLFKDLPDLVDMHRGLRIGLKSPNSYKLRITGLDGTVYWGREEMLEAWGELYLPEPERMAVMGAIDNSHSLAEGLQLIVLVDSKLRVYFYESEVLHLVALSVEDFLVSGAAFPPMESFEYGQHCAPETKEEYLQIMESAGIQRVQQATKDFVQSKEEELMDNLRFLASL